MITYIRCQDYSKKIEIQSENLFGFSYTYTQENEEWAVLIQGFANNLNKRIEEPLNQFFKQKKTKNIDSFNNLKNTSKLFDDESTKISLKGEEKFQMKMEISVEGTKKIDLTLQNFDLLLNLNLFFRILGFVNFDSSVVLINSTGF